MNVKRLIHSGFGKIIIPVLLGLGLATMFRRVCKDKNCIVLTTFNFYYISKTIIFRNYYKM